ncbi:hypothetical protein C7212DRAFT_351678 [Tuber magnatum]|uniref:G-patch domain-containing protein n=1 Tax=Tuber magnatum TaxID=42249 RepID=A0A317SP31_9PEZI|nr:hypothetical protein C7212DRAFT_351678 [Tuber magnatum]
MGLAAPRNKTKISADPRNTHWASNTSNFGHRILTSHGWAPGSTLGDISSTYHASGHITEASNTGVKIVLKGDNLGIGCKGGIKDNECTGLDLFQDLLGRLNGKEEVEKRVHQRKVEFVSGRYGMRFVRGETYFSSDVDKLIGDIRKMEEENAEAAKEKGKDERRRKKNKRKTAKAAKATQEGKADESSASPPAEEPGSKENEEKKMKKPKKSEPHAPTPISSSSESETKSKKRKRADNFKKEKKCKRDKKYRGDKKTRSKEFSDIETPTLASGTITPTALTGRHAIRHRHIAAKRSAVMDTKALNEILMIKA